MIMFVNPLWLIILSIVILIPMGFGFKFYCGPGAWWLNNYGAGIIYEVFWCLVGALFWHRTSSFVIVSLVFIITTFIEFLQLWHPEFLEVIRSTFIGRTLVGTSFSWWDIPHYIIGCFIGWFWIGAIRRIETRGK